MRSAIKDGADHQTSLAVPVTPNDDESFRRWVNSPYVLGFRRVGVHVTPLVAERVAGPPGGDQQGSCDWRLAADLVGRAWAGTGRQPAIAPALGGLSTEDGGPSKSGASGAVNRLLRPDSVRHMSVTTATQRLTAAHHETRRHNNKKARETGKTQLTGYLCRWWQVLGSNQRRLSRRFYSEPIPAHRNSH